VLTAADISAVLKTSMAISSSDAKRCQYSGGGGKDVIVTLSTNPGAGQLGGVALPVIKEQQAGAHDLTVDGIPAVAYPLPNGGGIVAIKGDSTLSITVLNLPSSDRVLTDLAKRGLGRVSAETSRPSPPGPAPALARGAAACSLLRAEEVSSALHTSLTAKEESPGNCRYTTTAPPPAFAMVDLRIDPAGGTGADYLRIYRFAHPGASDVTVSGYPGVVHTGGPLSGIEVVAKDNLIDIDVFGQDVDRETLTQLMQRVLGRL
jgi:hypothetical protein